MKVRVHWSTLIGGIFGMWLSQWLTAALSDKTLTWADDDGTVHHHRDIGHRTVSVREHAPDAKCDTCGDEPPKPYGTSR